MPICKNNKCYDYNYEFFFDLHIYTCKCNDNYLFYKNHLYILNKNELIPYMFWYSSKKKWVDDNSQNISIDDIL